MPSRRGMIALTDAEQEQFLNDGWTLQVASVGHNGFPHLVAMWYVVIDGKVHFTTFGKSQKILNLRRNPKITCMLESGKAYAELRGMVIEGEAELIEDNAFAASVMGKVGAKYSGVPVPMETTEQAVKAASKRIVVKVNPVDVYSWDHTKLAGRY